jgi:hypothetical protein
MSDILYERTMSLGPVVRIRRVSTDGATPVRAVLEVDRRAAGPRGGRGGSPPPLLAAEAENDPAAVASLLPVAQDDDAIERLLAQSDVR